MTLFNQSNKRLLFSSAIALSGLISLNLFLNLGLQPLAWLGKTLGTIVSILALIGGFLVYQRDL